MKSVWQWTLLWPVIIDKAIMQQNRVKSLHHNGDVCDRFLLFNINFSVLCHTIAIWLTIALAIFRYICVCYPTRGAALCSLQRAKVAIFAIYVTSAVVCIPNYMVTSSSSSSLSVASERIQHCGGEARPEGPMLEA